MRLSSPDAHNESCNSYIVSNTNWLQLHTVRFLLVNQLNKLIYYYLLYLGILDHPFPNSLYVPKTKRNNDKHGCSTAVPKHRTNCLLQLNHLSE